MPAGSRKPCPDEQYGPCLLAFYGISPLRLRPSSHSSSYLSLLCRPLDPPLVPLPTSRPPQPPSNAPPIVPSPGNIKSPIALPPKAPMNVFEDDTFSFLCDLARSRERSRGVSLDLEWPLDRESSLDRVRDRSRDRSRDKERESDRESDRESERCREWWRWW